MKAGRFLKFLLRISVGNLQHSLTDILLCSRLLNIPYDKTFLVIWEQIIQSYFLIWINWYYLGSLDCCHSQETFFNIHSSFGRGLEEPENFNSQIISIQHTDRFRWIFLEKKLLPWQPFLDFHHLYIYVNYFLCNSYLCCAPFSSQACNIF